MNDVFVVEVTDLYRRCIQTMWCQILMQTSVITKRKRCACSCLRYHKISSFWY